MIEYLALEARVAAYLRWGPSCPSVVVGLLCVCLGVGVIVGVCIYIYLVMQFACVLSCFSHIQLFASLWTVACQVLLSMGFSR